MSSYSEDFSDPEIGYRGQGESDVGGEESSGAGPAAPAVVVAGASTDPADGERALGAHDTIAENSSPGAVAGDVTDVLNSAGTSRLVANGDGDDGATDEHTCSENWVGWVGANTCLAVPLPVRPLNDLTTDEFCERLEAFRSPNVSLLVGPDKVPFAIPKELLCANSKFFDTAFNGKFKEGVEQSMHLEEETVKVIRMLMQFIYTGGLNVAKSGTAFEQISSYMEFFKLADKIDLIGPLDSIFEKLRLLMADGRSEDSCTYCAKGWVASAWGTGPACDCTPAPNWGHSADCDSMRVHNVPTIDCDPLREEVFAAEHLIAAFELRPGHVVRDIFARACVVPYVLSNAQEDTYNFRFDYELDNMDGFCRLLLIEVSKVLARKLPHGHKCNIHHSGCREYFEIKDPLTDRIIRLYKQDQSRDWGF